MIHESNVLLSKSILDLDHARDAVSAAFRAADPDGARAAKVFRFTFDQLYDGQHTGRFRWEQLFKTEKTHYGTLFEINLRREFNDIINDGNVLDYRILGEDIDCKYSQKMGNWMLPPESFGHLLLVATASDHEGTWSLGVVRATEENRRLGENRDLKTGLNARGRQQIDWLQKDAPLPPNVLLGLDAATLEAVLSAKRGQPRVIELLRLVVGKRIGRNTIATVAQQDDYMARVRDNGGGARTVLREKGFLIPSGDYREHREVAERLGAEVPHPGEFISLRVVPTEHDGRGTVFLDGRFWRLAQPGETVSVSAPKLPSTKKKAAR